MLRMISYIIIILFLQSCNKQTILSGKILDQESISNINYQNKENLITKLGVPSFIDPIENKFFYYSEKKYKKNAFAKKTDYSYVFVFEFDKNDNIVKSKVFDLSKKVNVDLIKDETSNEIVQRGLLERIFGGVGPQQTLETTP